MISVGLEIRIFVTIAEEISLNDIKINTLLIRKKVTLRGFYPRWDRKTANQIVTIITPERYISGIWV
jgi:hypothetical protein